MRKLSKITPEERSRINRANALKSVEARHKQWWSRHCGQHDHIGMPLKHFRMYSDDWTVFHRYARQMQMTKLDLLHQLIVPLRDKLKDLPRISPDNPWIKKQEEEY